MAIVGKIHKKRKRTKKPVKVASSAKLIMNKHVKGELILKEIKKLEAIRKTKKTKDEKDFYAMLINEQHDKLDALVKKPKRK